MRLTLRTMLAYMDNILDPEDANELRRRIENSEFAASLMRRIEAAVRRIRLESPMVDAKGMGADANTVAEYLDNTLPPERVPDFERVCLESDMHLAEVAACHQVLAQVLGRRVEIPPEIRRRVYGLAHGAPSAAVETAATSPSTADELRPTHRGRVWRTDSAPIATPPTSAPNRSARWAIAALVVLMLGAAALLIFGPWPRQDGGARQLADRPNAAPGPQDNTSTNLASADPTGTTDPSLEPASDASETPSDAPDASIASPGTDDDAQLATADEQDAGTASPFPDLSAAGPPEIPDSTGNLASGASGDSPAESPVGVEPVAPLPPATSPGGPSNLTDEEPSTTVDPSSDDTALAQGTANQETESADAVPAAPSVDALLPSSDSVTVDLLTPDELLLYAKSDEPWQKVTESAALDSSISLLSLPAFRPQVKLNETVDVTAMDARWQPAVSAEGQVTSAMQIDHGRFLLENGTPTPVHLEIRWAGRSARLRISANGGAAALEIARLRMPGDDPLVTEPHVVASLVVLQGIVRWEESDGNQHDLTAPSGVWTLDDRSAELWERPKSPEWADESTLKPIYRAEGVPVIAEALGGEEPPHDALRMLLEHRRAEVRALSALGLAKLGDYEGLLRALGDAQQHWAWTDIFQGLQDGLAESPAAAEAIRAACNRIYPAEGEMVFQFLVGYSPNGLRTGGADLLVQQLANPQLAIRVLAIENLQRITGGKTLGFRADASERQRSRTIIAWTRRLGRGEVAYQAHQLPESMQWFERAGLLQL